MKKLYFVLFLSLMLLSACQSDFEGFREQLTVLSKDGTIDHNDFKTLVNLVASSNDGGFKAPFITGGQLDSNRFALYLFEQGKLIYPNFNRQNVYLLRTAQNKKRNYKVNVFIENSLSMDGYVSGVTSFGQAVYRLLSDLKMAEPAGSINLNYINSKPIPWKTNANDNDIAGFVRDLTPADFQLRGGDRTNSDLQQCLKRALNAVDSAQLSVFVSDCIFSPGSHMNAADYLVNQQIALKAAFREKLDTLEFNTMILQYNADFNGTYYDLVNNRTKLRFCKRPFYIILSGSPALMEKLIGKQDVEKLRQVGFRQAFLLLHKLNNATDSDGFIHSRLSGKNRIGEFEMATTAHKANLFNASEGRGTPMTDGLFQFSIAADLSGSQFDEGFLLDTSNYKVPSNYKLSQVRLNTDASDLALKGMTHLFTLSTTKLAQEQDVILELKDNMPAWVDSTNSSNDEQIKAPAQLTKTFGLKYLVSGIADAYESKYPDRALFKLHVNVSKSAAEDSDSGGFQWGILILVAALAGVIIYAKNKK